MGPNLQEVDWKKYTKRVQHLSLRFARGRPEIDARDLQQAAYLAIIEAVTRYRTGAGASLDTFLHRRLAGAMIDCLRSDGGWTPRRGREVIPIHRVNIDYIRDLEGAGIKIEELDKQDVLDRVAHAVSELSPRRREVIESVAYRGETLKSAGAALGVSESRACLLYRDGVKTLRAELGITNAIA